MKYVLIAVSALGLLVLLAAPILHTAQVVSAGVSQAGMIVGTVAWFATAPFWMRYRP